MKKIVCFIFMFLFIALISSTAMSQDVKTVEKCGPIIKGIQLGMDIGELNKIIDELYPGLRFGKEDKENDIDIKTYKHKKVTIILKSYKDKLMSLKIINKNYRVKSDKEAIEAIESFKKDYDLPMYSVSKDKTHKLNNYVFEGDCYKILISDSTVLYEYINNKS